MQKYEQARNEGKEIPRIVKDVFSYTLYDDKNAIEIIIRDINEQKVQDFKKYIVDSDALYFVNKDFDDEPQYYALNAAGDIAYNLNVVP